LVSEFLSKIPTGSELQQEKIVIQRLLSQRQTTHYEKSLQRALTCLVLTGNKNSSPLLIQDDHREGWEDEDKNDQFHLTCESVQEPLLTLVPPTCGSSNQEDIFSSGMGFYFFSKFQPR